MILSPTENAAVRIVEVLAADKSCTVYPQVDAWERSSVHKYMDEVWMEARAGLNSKLVDF